MKSVLLSVQPRYCADMARGAKELEIRKSKPVLDVPFKCYVYCTKGDEADPHQLLEVHGEDGKIRKCNGMVFAEFVCDEVLPIQVSETGAIPDWYCRNLASACVSYLEMAKYIGWGRTGYGWHISDLKVYEQPKEIGCFKVCNARKVRGREKGIARAPQSWCYIREASPL